MARIFIKNLKDKYVRNDDHNYDENANHSSLNVSFKKYLCDFSLSSKTFRPIITPTIQILFLF